jgi:TonB family protein
MTMPELLALSLGLSIVVAGLAWVGVRLFERGVADPVLRERAWAAALYVPVLPVLMVAILLTTPRPVVEVLATTDTVVSLQTGAVEVASVPTIQTGRIAWAVLVLGLMLGLTRGVGLVRRTVCLHRLIREAAPAGDDVRQAVSAVAGQAGVTAPEIRLSPTGGEALVAGVFRPILILPASLQADPALRSVCAHELAHLKRGDHLALWIEEILLTALAINPLLRAIRDRRAAAREEACDLQVLIHADGDARRLYARSLLEALRVPAGRDVPALTFTSTRRIFVMHRLKAILSPAPVAGPRSRHVALGLGVALAAVAGAGSFALASQREAEVVARPVVAPVSRALPAPRPAVAVRVAPVAAPAALVAPQPKAEPAPVAMPVAAPEVVTNPSWAQHPMPRYPVAALEQGLTDGRADLSCTVEADGRVTSCSILSESPEGAGYGAAALEAAGAARLSPRTVEGASVGGTVRFTIRFTMRP